MGEAMISILKVLDSVEKQNNMRHHKCRNKKMTVTERNNIDLKENGFTIIENIYSEREIEEILLTIDQAEKTRETFRKSADLFAIRQFLKEIPETVNLIFSDGLKKVIRQLFGDNYFVVKSIYFDKPETSNWYVSYHQDLTISVDKKVEIENFGPWTTKQNQFAVQPPIDILENIFTVRIHLDDTDENNGALRVIPKSHLKKIYRPETIDWKKETETTCCVGKGGIMIMKPLILHSSGRTTNNKKRRVIHIEFSNQELPIELRWAERLY
jgi:ectoine hydroxylase-related dioxygenase (phytanoyl-CoA dioxygenase family)